MSASVQKSQNITVFFQKAKHNGLAWALKRIAKKILYKLFRYSDRTIVFKLSLSKKNLPENPNDTKGRHRNY